MSAGILARDASGAEYRIKVVDHPAGMVSLFDGEIRRTMSPRDAIELAVRLITASKGYFPGAISGTF